ncbi:transmembrane protein 132D [Denticeps clupeoides]|uniref:Transmembrane protein 132D-like n=1 Tax=Denticeps clupeoides TaxID=299321 RepID=A0AAY4CWB2_9TELE|nr:transmembrane protein 132D-like [Denticeps clupeoides]
MSLSAHFWRTSHVLLATVVAVATQELDSQEMADNPKSPATFPLFLPASFQVRDADYFLLKEAGQDFMRNSSMRSSTQPLLVVRASRHPVFNVSYGVHSVQRPAPLDLLRPVQLFRPSPGVFTFDWKVNWFVLTRRVFSSAPRVRVLFYVAGRDWDRGQRDPGGAADQLPCVTVYAFWQTQEVRGSCVIGAQRGTCMAEVEPPPGWFSLAEGTSSREGPATPARGNAMELYFQAQPSIQGQCGNGGRSSGGRVGGGPERAEYTPMTPMRRIGSVRLLQEPPGAASVAQLRLGDAIVIQLSSKPLKQTDIASFYILIKSASALDTFTLRAMLKKGVTFRTATPSNTLLWDTTMDTSADGTIAVVCHRKSVPLGKRSNSRLLEILQMDFEVEELSIQSESQVVMWQLVLPADTRVVGEMEGTMRIYTTQRDFVGLAPLVTDTEIINTAVLTGKRVAVPVRTVAVEADGSVTDVSDFTDCSSTNEDILKVSDRCDYVYVNGKEQKGRVRTLVNFTYSYLSAQLEMSVWIPQLPLQIELSDSELSQIKGWRIPIQTGKRPGWSSDEEERKGKGCMLQFQHAQLRVLAHFVAEQSDPREPQAFFLGPDWQVDVTKLVRYFLKVEDPRIVRLQAGRVLSGRDVGTTKIQVFSPLSDSVLAERSVRVLDDRVSITELGLQLVSGLSLGLQLSPGSNRAILATATTQEVLTRPKQGATLSSWLQFSDGTITPLDYFDAAHYRLFVSSLDESVVSIQGSAPSVSVVAEAEGQGALVRMEMSICEGCQKSKRKSTLAVGTGSLKVKFQVNGGRAESTGIYNNTNSSSGTGLYVTPGSRSASVGGKENAVDYGNDADEVDSDRRQREPVLERDVASSSASEREESAMRKVSTTAKSTDGSSGNLERILVSESNGGPFRTRNTSGTGMPRNAGDGFGVSMGTGKAPGNLVNYNFPSQVEVPRQEEEEEESMDDEDEDDEYEGSPANRPLTDLEIGMYTLLVVFCLAILVFLVNCISYIAKFRHKQIPAQGPEPAEHRHDWVWLGTDAELVMNVPGSPLQRDSHATTVIDIDKTASLPRGGGCQPAGLPPGMGRAGTLGGPSSRSESLHSPTSKRKRVQFTTFTSLERQHPKENGHGGIHWVGKEAEDCGGGGAERVEGGGLEAQAPKPEPLEQL